MRLCTLVSIRTKSSFDKASPICFLRLKSLEKQDEVNQIPRRSRVMPEKLLSPKHIDCLTAFDIPTSQSSERQQSFLRNGVTPNEVF